MVESSELLFNNTLMISVAEVFPPVSLNFAGGASMFLNPQDYLIQQNNVVSTHTKSFHRDLFFKFLH